MIAEPPFPSASHGNPSSSSEGLHLLHELGEGVPIVSRHEVVGEAKVGQGIDIFSKRRGLGLHRIVSRLVVALESILAAVRGVLVDRRLFGLLHQLKGTTGAFGWLLAVFHLQAGEVESCVILCQESGDLSVDIAVTRDVPISSGQLSSMRGILVPPVDASDLQ
jgi:hypothetical protein